MPCDYSKYPDNWLTEIRPLILMRAQDCCENCGVPNGVIVMRGITNPARYEIVGTDRSQLEDWQRDYDYFKDAMIEDGLLRPIRIILTIVHLDHDTTHNHPENLAALCQRCHLRHDARSHARHAKECPGQTELFANAITDNIINTSDEEIIAEVVEDHGDPEHEADIMRRAIEKAKATIRVEEDA